MRCKAVRLLNNLPKAVRLIIINLLILGIAFILFMAGIEIHYRYKYNIMLPKNIPEKYTWGHKIVNNSYGYREKEFNIQKKANHFRIMVLGDSLTWGAGLSLKERYSFLLEKKLQKKYSNKKIEVLNFGISGGPTIKERNILKKYYKKLQPDLIILGFCINDPQPKSQNYSKEREKYYSNIRIILKILLKLKLKGTFMLFNRIYENIMVLSKKIPLWPYALDRVYNPDSAEWRLFKDALSEIAELNNQVASCPPLFISLIQGSKMSEPTDYTDKNDFYLKFYLKWFKQAENAAKKAGFILVDCIKKYIQKYPSGIVMTLSHVKDGHPNAEMNKLYADCLYDTIIKKNIIK